ncbi:MAG: hypothetical protein V1733_01800 [bacterium]
MILIADSGSTKTFWALVVEGIEKKIIQTQGLNPYFTSPGQIKEILHEELVHNLVCDEITDIFFYGAGCSTENNNNLVGEQLRKFFRKAGINVFHDILGAARALFGNRDGIACILGTGCNSCFYNGTEVFSEIPSLGYLFGDEGAGSSLGKKLLAKYLKKELPEELKTAFDQAYRFRLEDILNSLYNKPFPNRYLASFSPFIHAHINHPVIHDLVYFSFVEFFETHVTKYAHYASHPTGFIGSIAFYYQDILREAAASESITVSKILQSPVQGLIEYHLT